MKNFIKRIWSNYLDYQQKRAAYYALQSMSDKQLSDIGIPRCDINRRVNNY